MKAEKAKRAVAKIWLMICRSISFLMCKIMGESKLLGQPSQNSRMREREISSKQQILTDFTNSSTPYVPTALPYLP